MQTKLLELRPNRSLLNSDFDGYKLSLTEVPTTTEQLKVPADRLVPDASQYSLLHAKLYALHNHLIGEKQNVYFVDKELSVQKFTIDSELNQLSQATVWQIPLQKERTSGDYNVSMKLPSENIAVVGDGAGYLHLLDRRSEPWRVVFSGEVAGPEEKFVVCDAVYKEAERPELHLLLLSVRQKSPNERHSTVLHWITLQKSDSWNQIALRELTVKGFVQYAHLEKACDAVCVVSDSGCKFTLDSEKEVKETAIETAVEKKYTWTQTRDDVTVKFPLPRGATRSLVEVKAENARIEVRYEQGILLEGSLCQRIDADMTTWSVENDALELVVQKSETGLMWPEFVQGDVHGEHVPDRALVEEIAERLAPLTSDTEAAPPSGTTFNSQQVEECDFECDKLTVLERLCCDTHNISHRVNFGSHQVLLTVDLDTAPPALGVRFDVDTCIWQPKIESDNFSIEHIGTLLAMGYIQASKQQMKFFVCSPDLSYSAICESTRHIFLYCQNKKLSSSNELRNRTTGKRISTLAQQQVINLPSSDEILGVYASNSHLYVLGETFITALKL